MPLSTYTAVDSRVLGVLECSVGYLLHRMSSLQPVKTQSGLDKMKPNHLIPPSRLEKRRTHDKQSSAGQVNSSLYSRLSVWCSDQNVILGETFAELDDQVGTCREPPNKID